jgi:TPR repeat protein
LAASGEGVPRNGPYAASLYKWACDALGETCTESGRVFEAKSIDNPRDLVRAKGLYGEACGRSVDKACQALKRLGG